MKEKEEISTEQKTIKDPLIEPFFITKDQYCYTLNEVITPDIRYTNSDKTYTKPVGHFSGFDQCLKKIAVLKLDKLDKNYSSIKDYINDWREITKQFKNLTEF